MALASPTPMGSSHFASLSRRPQVFEQGPNQSLLARAGSSPPRVYSLGDSSDDEIPVPVFKCSALTNALLNDAAVVETYPSGPRRVLPEHLPPPHEPCQSRNPSRRNVGPSEERLPGNMMPSIPPNFYPKRKVRLTRTPESSRFFRPKSVSTIDPAQAELAADKSCSPSHLRTPAPIPRRTVRLTSSGRRSVLTGSSSKPSGGNSASSQEEVGVDSSKYPATVARPSIAVNQGSVSKHGQPVIGRVRYGEDVGVKKVAGAFMSVRPRRGRRHISDEEQSTVEDNGHQFAENNGLLPHQSRSMDKSSGQDQPLDYGSAYQPQFSSGSPVSCKDNIKSILKAVPSSPSRLCSNSSMGPVQPPRFIQTVPTVFKASVPQPNYYPACEQENELPPLYVKRETQDPPINLGQIEELKIKHDGFISRAAPVDMPYERPILAPKSQNTPRRPAPPPPKMSLLDAATSTAGAASMASKRSRLKVNGKIFTRLDCIGRGGSSRVYRVMAENSKFFALKKVSLDDADESAVRGFKGEIELLRKLEGVERVIHLYDYELNEDKGTLTVLMEMGELDMNKILEMRLKSDDAKFDPSFVRHYWKEMLECLEAIHEYDIVHSDLKPHNFVLVQGRLKLIDFGIANAIAVDETVNVHRDTQIGTPNYMSPESLMDFNARPDARGRVSADAPKLMKLGKPSDVWSLGCILYQMTYGRAPFAHIANQMQRCQAIIDFSYAIDFPSTGIGGVPVPASLVRTLRRCLNRDQNQRPAAAELLSVRDPFLYPVELPDGALPMTEELLGRIFLNFSAKLKEKTPSDADLVKAWPQGYFDRIRKNLAAGDAP